MAVDGSVDAEAAQRAWEELGGDPLDRWTLLSEVKHIFSHIRLSAYPAIATLDDQNAPEVFPWIRGGALVRRTRGGGVGEIYPRGGSSCARVCQGALL